MYILLLGNLNLKNVIDKNRNITYQKKTSYQFITDPSFNRDKIIYSSSVKSNTDCIETSLLFLFSLTDFANVPASLSENHKVMLFLISFLGLAFNTIPENVTKSTSTALLISFIISHYSYISSLFPSMLKIPSMSSASLSGFVGSTAVCREVVGFWLY